MTNKEAMKLALEALQTLMIERGSIYDKAITAIKERLAQPEQEPVGSVVRWVDGSLIHGWFGDPPPEGTLLYAHPPQRTEQEPVAWMSPSWIDPNTRGWQSDSFESIPIEGWLPIYTTPPQRTWVGLTEQEHTDIAVECGCMSADWVFYGAAVERKVKERNT